MMETKNLESLLKEISGVVTRERGREATRRVSGEDYDVFRVLRLQRKEVDLHSAFIADLLDPRGSHGMGTAFLESFMDMMDGYLDLEFGDLTRVTVTKEYAIGPISRNGRKGGRIDILLSDGDKAVVIENKIGAGDQKYQLLRYSNYCRERYSGHGLVYLNLYGSDPSEESTGGEDLEYTVLSYREDIRGWIGRCMELCDRKTTLRETLRQYRTTLDEITGTMSEESMKELVSIATDERNMEAVLGLLSGEQEIKTAIRKRFLTRIKDMADDMGYTCNDEDLETMARLERVTKDCEHVLSFVPAGCDGIYCMKIGYDNSSCDFWYGIGSTSSRTCKISFVKTLPHIWGADDKDSQTKEYPYGWDFFYGDDGNGGHVDWYDWDSPSTLLDMHNGKILSFIERELFRKTADDNLIGILEDNLKKGNK